MQVVHGILVDSQLEYILKIKGGKVMNEIAELISNVGFPIMACIFMYKQQLELNKTISELSNTLKGIDARLDTLERGNK
jgi:uncharacterized protein YoxC